MRDAQSRGLERLEEARRSRCRQTRGGGGRSESPRRWWRRRASGGGAAPASAARDGSLFSGPTLSPRESPVTGGENSAGAAAPPCTDATPAPPGLDTSRTLPPSRHARTSAPRHRTIACKYPDINCFKHCHKSSIRQIKHAPAPRPLLCQYPPLDRGGQSACAAGRAADVRAGGAGLRACSGGLAVKRVLLTTGT